MASKTSDIGDKYVTTVDLYAEVINKVVEHMRVDFDEAGVDSDVLHYVKTEWKNKSAESKCLDGIPREAVNKTSTIDDINLMKEIIADNVNTDHTNCIDNRNNKIWCILKNILNSNISLNNDIKTGLTSPTVLQRLNLGTPVPRKNFLVSRRKDGSSEVLFRIGGQTDGSWVDSNDEENEEKSHYDFHNYNIHSSHNNNNGIIMMPVITRYINNI
ncbi:hypothetical protein HELRODRAFT_171153 [Helobdella robusta]|uniref:Uncharacterized protein n=1 Tax=Helobdella robusta TaxID=6412 RepID=T1F3V6_HELRO|nr:hypothetical protein HELRODRAFT_171153 [Helobdella robusta]ESO05515.1 hypothetical protein HELRODRAFT_171153 [Helobdella robusta]